MSYLRCRMGIPRFYNLKNISPPITNTLSTLAIIADDSRIKITLQYIITTSKDIIDDFFFPPVG